MTTETIAGRHSSSAHLRPLSRITVGIPVYNGENYLAEAIESIQRQTFTDWDMVICDNASTDRTAEICREYAESDPRIRYVVNPHNIGLYPNFSRAFALGTAPYFKWQAHDDLCDKGLLAALVEGLDQNPSAAMAFSSTRMIDPAGQLLDDAPSPVSPLLASSDPAERFFTFMRPLLTTEGPNVPMFTFGAIRRSMVTRHAISGSYTRAHEGLFTDLILRGPFIAVAPGLEYFRVHEANSGRLGGGAAYPGRNWHPREWQAILDPRLTGRLRLPLSIHQHHFEYARSIAMAPLAPAAKARMLAAYLWEDVLAPRVSKRFGRG